MATGSQVEVRTITPDDWQAWRELRLAALQQSPEAFGSRYDDWVNASEVAWRRRLSDGPMFVIASVAGEPCGLAAGHIDDASGQRFLISLWVRPSCRRKGVAEALIGAVAQWAKVESDHLYLNVRVDNDAARSLYEKLGFLVVGPAPHEEDEPPELVMRKRTRKADSV